MKKAAHCTLVSPILALTPSLAQAQEPRSAANADGAVRKSAATPGKPTVSLNVKDYGATGDGKTKDTVAIQQTIERCSAFGGGEVVVPAGDYLAGALVLRAGVLLRVEEGATLNGSPDMSDYPLAQVRWEGHWIKGYSALIAATDAENVGIAGPGKIIGSPAVVGRLERPSGLRLPALLEFVNCNNVRVENCYTQNYGMWSIHPVYCDNITFKDVVVKSGADGIDVDSCRHVTIDRCDFDTTDDCISIKSGRGIEGYTIARPTDDVHISNCTFVDKVWACIGIGSETSGGIRNVYVDHCKCLGAGTFAIYVKSRPGRGAFIENIYMSDLEVSGAKNGFLRFNILNSGIADTPNLVPGDEGIPTIRNFEFRNIKVTDMPELVHGIDIHPRKPLDGFVLENIIGTCGKGISLANIKNARLSGIKVTGFDGPLLKTSNVTGTGLAGATPIGAEDMPKVPDPIPAPVEPYKLH
ncbi:MAG: glycoside hydrolase family 28 protein [Terracidiphilus sp.]